jgi:hypothetical protein
MEITMKAIAAVQPPDPNTRDVSPSPVLVRDFFEFHFRPLQLQRARHRMVNRFKSAIGWLERYLARDALIDDLTAANITKIQFACVTAGLQQSSVRVISSALSSIAKRAYKLGLLNDWRRVKLRKDIRLAQSETSDKLQGTPPADSLTHAWETLLRPRLIAKRVGATRLKLYASTVARFNAYCSHYATSADVTPENMKGFQEAQRIAGKRASGVTRMRYAIRRIARLIDADTARQLRTDAKQLPSPASGSLREFFENTYRPLSLLGKGAGRLIEYRHTLRLVYEFAGRDTAIGELTDAFAADFLGWLLRARKNHPDARVSRGIKAITVNAHRSRLFAVWRFAVTRGVLANDPRVKKLRETIDVPDAWTEEETCRLIEAPLANAVKDFPPIKLGFP